jgi:PIN domain nuclease of toxin-antitoxin system
MRLIVDTQAFLWFIMGDNHLTPRWRTAIESKSNQTYVSIASLWEIAIKLSNQKLEIDMSFDELIEFQVERNGFVLLPIFPHHLKPLTHLPHHHRDPFDRIIIAQAQTEKFPIVTTDSQFKRYDVELLE